MTLEERERMDGVWGSPILTLKVARVYKQLRIRRETLIRIIILSNSEGG